MKQPAKFLTFQLLVSILILLGPASAFSQSHPERQPCPDMTAETIGCELIAWSRLQEPAPLPDAPSPPTGGAKEQNAKAVALPGRGRASDVDPQGQQTLQTVAGVIVRSQGEYWLKVNLEMELLLDDERIGRQYEGRPVHVRGVVDVKLRTLKIRNIEPIW
jgi:hypothetical protein